MEKTESDNLILRSFYLLLFSISVLSFFIIYFLWNEQRNLSENNIIITEYHLVTIQNSENILHEIEKIRLWFRKNNLDLSNNTDKDFDLTNPHQINNLTGILNTNVQNILKVQNKFLHPEYEENVKKAEQQVKDIHDYLKHLSLMEKEGEIARFSYEQFDKNLTPLYTNLTQLKKSHYLTYKNLIDINSTKSSKRLFFTLSLLISLIVIGVFFVIKILLMSSKVLAIQTETKKALSLSEKRYRAFIESSNDWVWECDKYCKTVYSNTAIIDILGYSPDEIIGKSCLDHMYHEDKIEIENMIPDCIAFKTGWGNKIIRWINNEGSIKYLESSSTIIINDNGEFAGFRGVDRDVTSRILAEQAIEKSQQTLNCAFDATPDGVSITRLSDGIFVYANEALARFSQFSVDEIIGNSVYDLDFYVHPETRNELINKLLKDNLVTDFQTELRRKDGEIIPASLSSSLVDMSDAKYIITISRDITESKAAENELIKLTTALEQSHDAIFITDSYGVIEYVNSRLLELTEFTSEELIGHKPNIWKSNETPEEIYDELWKTITKGNIWKGDILNCKKGGENYWSSDVISPIRSVEGKITHYLGTQEDITKIRNLNQQLTWQASHDSLTGLVNRREFERRLERITLAYKHDDASHALFFMDLDQFQVVNDTCGHTAGDELLRQLSDVLLDKMRKRDTLARIGGDEFAVLMEHCSLDHAYRVANSLLEATQKYQFQWNHQIFRVGVSIGLIPITKYDISHTQLLKQADNACYIAKEQGRNRIHLYSSDDKETAHRHNELSWVAKLYQALEENSFSLFIQTITPLGSEQNKETMSYEILLRMHDDTGNIVSPALFMPAAERFSIAAKLDQWMFRNVIESLKTYPDFLQHVDFISLNLSGSSLTENNFLEYIVDLLFDNIYSIDPTKICFEITETAAIANLTLASKFISTLKEMGCLFALDDFGTGLSSFGYLKNLSVDYLKIDGMFVKNILDDPIDNAMVKSINDIGHVMGIKTIAEYVENDEIKGMLREIGVDYAQGYGIDKPSDLNDFLKDHKTKTNNEVKLKRPDRTA